MTMIQRSEVGLNFHGLMWKFSNVYYSPAVPTDGLNPPEAEDVAWERLSLQFGMGRDRIDVTDLLKDSVIELLKEELCVEFREDL